MKLYRVVNQDGFKTYALNKVERVTHKNKTYIVSRFVDYQKPNVLTVRKQRIVLDMVSKGIDIKDLKNISKIIGVSESTINAFLSMHFKQENYRNAQSKPREAKYCCKKVEIVCLTDNTLTVYDSVTNASKAVGCSGSNVSNYCKSNKVYRHKATGKEYKMRFIEEAE